MRKGSEFADIVQPQAFDWNDIAAKCNTTAGAASKRYSRMKLAFENGAAAPPATPTKKGADKGTDGASPTKRKRGAGATAAKKSGDDGEGDAGAKVKEEGDAGEDEGEQEEEKPKAKRVRTPAKKKATVPKKTASTKAVKAEEEIQDELSAEHDDVKPAARSLFQELEDAVQNAQAKYHGGAGGLDGNLGGEDEDELVQASKLPPFSFVDIIFDGMVLTCLLKQG